MRWQKRREKRKRDVPSSHEVVLIARAEQVDMTQEGNPLTIPCNDQVVP